MEGQKEMVQSGLASFGWGSLDPAQPSFTTSNRLGILLPNSNQKTDALGEFLTWLFVVVWVCFVWFFLKRKKTFSSSKSKITIFSKSPLSKAQAHVKNKLLFLLGVILGGGT